MAGIENIQIKKLTKYKYLTTLIWKAKVYACTVVVLLNVPLVAVYVDRTHDLQILNFTEVNFSLTLSQLS